MDETSYAYLFVKDGYVDAVAIDSADEPTSELVADHIASGGYVERVLLEEARAALFRPWPPEGDDA